MEEGKKKSSYEDRKKEVFARSKKKKKKLLSTELKNNFEPNNFFCWLSKQEQNPVTDKRSGK